MSSAGLRSEAQEARLQMRETQWKMSELNAVSWNHRKFKHFGAGIDYCCH